MPKQTFFNLPQDKRRMIENAALDEFSGYGFDGSNINRIVEQSKIAKGSFYQYFEDKKDLYFHLMDTVVTRKLEALKPILDNYRKNSIAYNLEELVRLGIEFADSDPKLYLLGEDFTAKRPEFVQEFVAKYTPVSLDVFGSFLETAEEKGELRKGMDLHLTKIFINTLFNQVTVGLISKPKEQRDYVIGQLIVFIERAILPNGKNDKKKAPKPGKKDTGGSYD